MILKIIFYSKNNFRFSYYQLIKKNLINNDNTDIIIYDPFFRLTEMLQLN